MLAMDMRLMLSLAVVDVVDNDAESEAPTSNIQQKISFHQMVNIANSDDIFPTVMTEVTRNFYVCSMLSVDAETFLDRFRFLSRDPIEQSRPRKNPFGMV